MPIRNTLTIVIVAIVSLVCYQKATHNRYASMVSHAMEIIENNYIEEVAPRELFENAMQGMVHELDEYSDYIGPEHFQQFQQTIDQEFVGIGVEVEGPPDADELRVVSPVYDSPAYRVGMRAGDLILEIDGVSTKTMDLNDAVTRMKGPPGTTRHVADSPRRPRTAGPLGRRARLDSHEIGLGGYDPARRSVELLPGERAPHWLHPHHDVWRANGE